MREGRGREGEGGEGNKEERSPLLLIIIVYIDSLLLISCRITGRNEGRKEGLSLSLLLDRRKEGRKEGGIIVIINGIHIEIIIGITIDIIGQKEGSIIIIIIITIG